MRARAATGDGPGAANDATPTPGRGVREDRGTEELAPGVQGVSAPGRPSQSSQSAGLRAALLGRVHARPQDAQTSVSSPPTVVAEPTSESPPRAARKSAAETMVTP
jgi:hypothetical protein